MTENKQRLIGHQIYYRYEEIIYEMNEGDPELCLGRRGRLNILHFPVTKETPCGVWIKIPWIDSMEGKGKKFILTNARKKYACPTIEEARESFMARKRRQIMILKGQLERARLALSLMKEELKRLGIEEVR